MPVDLQSCDDGVLLPVRAQPGARKNGIVGVHDGRLKVAVTQPAEKGKANDALLRVLAKSLGLKRSQVALHSGPTSSQKVFLVSGITRDDLRARLAEIL